MMIRVDETGTVAALRQLLDQVLNTPDVRSCLIFACDGNQYAFDEVNAVILGKPVFGGIFPQIIALGKRLERGAVVLGLPASPSLFVAKELGNRPDGLEKRLAAWEPPIEPGVGTLMVFVDGFSVAINVLIEALFNQFGLEINFIGGGCGSLNLTPKPCVITPEGLLQDAAVLALLPLRCGVGVAHGWTEVSDAFKVTGASGNTIETLDWKPAFDVYREVVERHDGRSFDHTPFFDVAKAYPFGIAKYGAEMVVRDPLMIKEKSLVCVGRVPQESFVHILHGNAETLVKAAGKARDLAYASLRGAEPTAMIFIDCISRVLFLGNEFERELATVRMEGMPMVGALTIGEIANCGHEFLEFYNKTSVVGLLAANAVPADH